MLGIPVHPAPDEWNRFYNFSMKIDQRKVIANPEVVDEIKAEMARLGA